MIISLSGGAGETRLTFVRQAGGLPLKAMEYDFSSFNTIDSMSYGPDRPEGRERPGSNLVTLNIPHAARQV
jgi:hypothetical protein